MRLPVDVRVEATFNSALQRPVAEREAFIAEACGEEGEMLIEVRALLAAHDAAGDFLEEPRMTPEIEEQMARLKPEEAGEMIGPYKLLEPLGEGGFGTVWMAEQEVPVRRRVALKIIKMGMDTKEVIARFQQEEQALAMMDHPNIAKVFDAGATQFGRPYFVMELVRGIPITHYCDQHKLPTVERLRLFIAVCHALQHAHQKGIIHRDIKPNNVLVTMHDGGAVPKVIDFGVAKATQQRLTDLTVFTQFEQMIGTPLYMSPEQAEMSGLDVDTRSDIYSLGVVLYELLTGRTPFDAEELMRRGYDEIRKMIREQEPPKPSTALSTMARDAATDVAQHRQSEPPKLARLIRGDLDWIVMKALEKDRSRRYETANGFALDIERHLAGEPIIARPPTTLYRLDRMVRRNKLAFSAAAGVLLALIAGAGFSLWQAREAEREAARASEALLDLQKTAPAFAEQARTMAAREEFAEALEKLDTAAKLRPDEAEYRVARGDLLQCQLRLAEAVAEYRGALAIAPEHPRAKTNAELCDRLLATNADPTKLTPESLRELADSLEREHRPAAQRLAVARRLGEEKKVLLDYWIERLADLPLPPERPLAERLTLRADGLLALDLQGTRLTDLSALEGVPLGEINATGCTELQDLQPLRALPLTELRLASSGVTDLAPLSGLRTLKTLDLGSTAVRDLTGLQGLPLAHLSLNDARSVSDLTPLRGMPLQDIYLNYTGVTDLAPLAGMPLTHFWATNLSATDCSPLTGCPLEACALNGTKVTDLGFLKNAPLRKLDLTDSPDARNFAAIAGCQTLESIKLPATALNLPVADLDAITALRDLPALKTVVAGQSAQKGPIAADSSAEFWKKWDLLITVARPLRAAGCTVNARVLDDGTLSVGLLNQPISDLSILEGTPISRLAVQSTKVSDLRPVRTMKLTFLDLWDTPVTDLSPLRGLPLTSLNLGATNVTDLSPLEGMPLADFFADRAPFTDYAPLAKSPTLKNIHLPRPMPGAPPLNLEPLRSLPNLERISFQYDWSTGPICTAKVFWAHWDGLGWMRALQDGQFNFTAEQLADGRWKVLTGGRFSDCSIFKGAAIAILLVGPSVVDLSPLRDLPLEELDAGRSQVADISTLRGSTLLRSLKSFSLYGTKVTDFSPLAECVNVKWLNLCRTAVRDVGFLRGLKVCTGVGLTGTEVSDISPLSEMPELRRIYLPQGAREVEKLRQLSNLRVLSYDYEGQPKQTAEEFWQMHDEVPWVAKLKAEGINPTVERREDGLWSVDLEKQPITDLTPLRGSRIWYLDLRDTPVADLEPLRGMPLEILWVGGTKVTDLAPLAGMRLKWLHAANTKVADISVLRGMPLEQIAMGGGVPVDLAPLHEMDTLELVNFARGSTNIEGLRRLPKVRTISYDYDNENKRFKTTAAEFWQLHDEVPWVAELKAKGITATVKRREDGLWSVDLQKQPITDLTPLRGSRIRYLDLRDTPVADLEPLRGMPLTYINVNNTPVTDLSPLRGMPLKAVDMIGSKVTDITPLAGMKLNVLNISSTPVKDISVVRDMPLKWFYMRDGSPDTDITPLANISSLTEVNIPRGVKDVEVLRSLPKVRRFGYSWVGGGDGQIDTSWEEFWAEFDRKKKP